METDYRVRLEAFEGPLDLLLYLTRKAEVDIHDIPVATIADQYMAYLEGIERIDIELAGEFLLMAATLMEIKSRMLAAEQAAVRGERGERPSDDDEEMEDPRQRLITQLLEYKRYRDAADGLQARMETWSRRYPSARAAIAQLQQAEDEEASLDLGEVDMMDLVQAFGRIYEAVNFDRLGEHEIVDDDTPIELHAADIVDRLEREAAGRKLPLRGLFAGRSRGEMIGLFLAMLELVRQRRVRVMQEEGEIVLDLRNEPQVAEEPPSPEEDERQ